MAEVNFVTQRDGRPKTEAGDSVTGGQRSAITQDEFARLCDWLTGEKGLTLPEIGRLTWTQIRLVYLRGQASEDAKNSPMGAPGQSGRKSQFWKVYSYRRVLCRETGTIREYRDDEIQAMWSWHLQSVRERRAEMVVYLRSKGLAVPPIMLQEIKDAPVVQSR